MKKLLILSALLLLSACASRPADPNKTLSFRVMAKGEVFTDFSADPAKAMNVVVVRTDLSQFEHLRPVMDKDGQWSVPHEFHAPGAYWVFGDFVESKGGEHIMRLDRAAGTTPSPKVVWTMDNLLKSPQLKGKLGDLAVVITPVITPVITGKNATLTYAFTDAAGKPVAPAVGGFSAAIGEDGYFQRLENKGNDAFVLTLPEKGKYRLFTELTVGGKPYVVVSDLAV